MEAIKDVIWCLNTLADGCGALASVLLRFNELVGARVLAFVLLLCDSIGHFSRNLGYGVYYLYKDFVLFLNDIAFAVVSVGSTVEDAIDGTAQCVVLVVRMVHSLVYLVMAAITATIGVVLAAVIYVWSSIGYLLLLLLRSCLLLLQLLPYTLSQAFICTCRGLAYLADGAWQSVIATVAFFSGAAVGSVGSVRTFVWTQPRDVYSGIAILCVCLVLVRLGSRLNLHGRLARRIAALRRSRSSSESGTSSTETTPPPFTMTLRRSTRQDKLKSLQRQLEQEREKQLCVVCQDAERSIILLPCRHFALCRSCIEALLERQHTCPVCRNLIYEIIPVYA